MWLKEKVKANMNIVFRVDSSAQIGSGHLMRCLTLANQLRDRANIFFVCRELEFNLSSLVNRDGFNLIVLSNSEKKEGLTGYEKWLTVKQEFDAVQTKEMLKLLEIDYLIIDNYAIDKKWEKIVRSNVKKIMVIDDLANREHDCDILLDQNYYNDKDRRYVNLVPKHCKLLLGPQYVLLREEFYEARKQMRIRDGSIRNILVFFGGSDLTNETMKTLRVLDDLNRTDIQINVVVGDSNKNKECIKEYCQRHENILCFCQVNNMAELMNEADLAIGAGGSSTWERCFLGLPSIVIATAENQVKISRDCDKLGIIKYIGNAQDITQEDIKRTVELMMKDQELIKSMMGKMQMMFSKMASSSIVDEVFK